MSVAHKSDDVVACTNLTKVYENGTVALKNLTLHIEAGLSFGLLGENGAGKSTLVRLIMGFILPTRGELRVLGQSRVNHAHPRIGYLHERPYVELRFTGKKYLTYMAQLAGLWGAQASERVNAVLEQVELSPAAHQRLGSYSKGMLQRLCIAQALLTDPDFLILDEPTGGLDPYSQWKVRQIISELRTRGKTLLICSHYLAEVETLCDTIGIMQAGQMIRHSSVKELIQKPNAVEITLQEGLQASEIVANLAIGEYIVDIDRNVLKIRSDEQQKVLETLVQAKIPILALHQVSQTLEEVYIQTTRPARERQQQESKSGLALSSSEGTR